MPEFFSSDGSLYLQAPVIFVVIAVVLLIGYGLFRRFSGRGLSMTAASGSRSRQPRLGIVDIYELDRQRQLILLRRDNVEHLLLIGGPNDVVIERNVQRGGTARLPTERVIRPEVASDLEGAENGLAPGDPARLPNEPSFELPVTVPPPLPGSTTRRDNRAPPLDPALFEPQAERATSAEAPATGMSEARSRASRFLRRTLPPLDSIPSGAAENVPIAEPPPAQPDPSAAPPPIIQAPEPRSVDPVVLSDMARQLEVALRRPSSAVTPPPGQTPRPVPPPPPVPEPPDLPKVEALRREPEAATDRVAAAMAGAETPPAPPPPPAEPLQLRPLPPKTEPRPEPAPKPGPASPPPAAKPDAAAPPAARAVANPFSVEEIEAEFARLLGRPLDKSS